MGASSKNSVCDGQRLRDYLELRLTAQDEADIEAHLDQCLACRRQISDWAAEPHWWIGAGKYLQLDAWDEPGSGAASERAAVSTTRHERASSELVLRQLREWLDPTDDPQYIGRFQGYEINGVIGYGGMGVVLKGFERSLNRFVAVKVLSPVLATSGAARTRFAREAQAAAAVLHENVIAIYRVGDDCELPYLVMPYVSGVSLQRRVDDEGPLPLLAILRIGRQIAAGLAAAHIQGLVHRDIKPANILLERGVERVTITDFGLARAADDGSLTRTGVIAGTPQYMSPEQARGERIDPRSDLFSLGSVMYAMASGHPPFRAETGYGILRRIADCQPRPIRDINADIPAWLEAIIGRLHAKSPAARIQTAEELTDLLDACLAHVRQPTVSPLPAELRERPPHVVSRKSHHGRRHIAWSAWGMLIVLLATSLAIVYFGRVPPDINSSTPANSTISELEKGDVPPAATTPGENEPPHVASTNTPWEDGLAEQLEQLDDSVGRLHELERGFWDNDSTGASLQSVPDG